MSWVGYRCVRPNCAVQQRLCVCSLSHSMPARARTPNIDYTSNQEWCTHRTGLRWRSSGWLPSGCRQQTRLCRRHL